MRRHRLSYRTLTLSLVLASIGSTLEAADPPLPQTINFNRDIRPILSNLCYHCHGPDKTKRQAKMRFDTRAGLFAKRDDHHVVVPGKPSASAIYQRISSQDDDERMPPADSGLSITLRQAQAAAAERKEMKGNVAFVKTTAFARPAEQSPNVGHGHHWFGNAESYFLIGDALGEKMLELVSRRR